MFLRVGKTVFPTKPDETPCPHALPAVVGTVGTVAPPCGRQGKERGAPARHRGSSTRFLGWGGGRQDCRDTPRPLSQLPPSCRISTGDTCFSPTFPVRSRWRRCWMRLSSTPRRFAELSTAMIKKPHFPSIRLDIPWLTAERRSAHVLGSRNSPGTALPHWRHLRLGAYGMRR